MLIHWIWLAHRPGVNDRMKVTLLQHFRDPEDIFFADSEAFDHIEGLSEEAAESLRDKNLIPAEEILEACHREKLHVLTYRDAAYPARLKNITDPPIVLYYKGQLPDFDTLPVIAVVGTRKASAYGLTTAKRLGYQIGKCGGIVVSGMAYGIDGMAMSGALTAGRQVVGVLGCGADIVYPLSNRGLFKDAERYGCILSEFPPGYQPTKWSFPKRNRIISGLSNGVLVVEAPEKSGSLITARLAAEQGRDVFVVPGNIDLPSFVGSNRLLRDGAIHKAAGIGLLKECRTLGGCNVGQSKMTGAYQLPCKKVIHTVGPVWYGGSDNERKMLESCYDTAMQLAEEHHLKSIAFSCISTGVFGFPKAEAAQIAKRVICEHIRNGYDGEVIICCFSEDDAQYYM